MGVAGLIQGGGLGLISRAYGLSADNLLRATIVLADGQSRTVQGEEELFWAIRGAGGNEFGIVTDMTLQLREPLSNRMAWFSVHFPFSSAFHLIRAWQAYAPKAPDALTALLVISKKETKLYVVFMGSAEAALGLYRTSPLFQVRGSVLGPAHEGSFIDMAAYFAFMSVPELAEATTALATNYWKGASAYVQHELSDEGIHALLKPLDLRGYIILDPLGGQIRRVPAHATVTGARMNGKERERERKRERGTLMHVGAFAL